MRFEANPNFEKEIERELEYRNGKVRVAEGVTGVAKTLAPVGVGPYPERHPGKPGDYKRSLQVKIIGPKVYVTTTDYKGHWVEWGSVNNPTHATIRKAVIQSGLRLREFPKGRNRTIADAIEGL